MIEFDVDMGYLLEEGELDCVVLNDENGEHEPMEFRPSGGECEMEELERWDGSDPHYRCKACGHENNEDYLPRFCPNCGKAVKTC